MKVTCESIRDLLPLYCDGVCSGESRKMVEEHLETCESCREELRLMGAALEGPRLAAWEEAMLQAASSAWKRGKSRSFAKGCLLALLTVLLLLGAYLGLHWSSTADENDLDALAAQAADYLGHRELTPHAVEQKGDYLALLCSDGSGAWALCVFDRDAVFQDRWRANGGKKSFGAGELTSWNYGSPRGEAVLIFCGAALPQEAHWYTFRNSGVSYVCPIDSDSVLDVFVLPDTSDIGGSPLLLDGGKLPLESAPVTYTGGPLLCQDPALSFLPDDGICYSGVTERRGGLEITYRDGRGFSGELVERKTYSATDFLLRLPTFGEEPADLVPDTVSSVEGRTYAGRDSGEDGGARSFTIWELTHDDGSTWLWLGEGGQESVGRVYELIDLGSFHPGAVSTLWTRTASHPWMALRFEGNFTSVLLTAGSGSLSAIPPRGSEPQSDVGSSLTIAPGDVVYWDPSEQGSGMEETELTFRISRPDRQKYIDSVKLRPVSQCPGLFGATTCAVSMDWGGLFSSQLHYAFLSADPETGELVVDLHFLD